MPTPVATGLWHPDGMEALLWLLVPVGYALGVLIAEVLLRLFTDQGPAPRALLDPPLLDRQSIVLHVVDGREVQAWG